MDNITREKFLKIALVAIGAIFFTIYPLSLIWPSGWQWHGGHGQYYLQMICGVYAVLGAYLIAAARNPSEHRSLISFTVWSSFAHASIMAAQAIYDGHEIRHLVGDVPALLLAAGVLCISLQRGSREWSAHSSAMGFPHRYLVGKYGPSGPLALSSGSYRFGPDCVAKLFAALRKSNYRIRLNGALNRCCAPFARRSLSAAARVALHDLLAPISATIGG